MAPWEEEASGAEKVPRGGRLIAHGPPRCCGRRAARRGPARAAGIAALLELGLASGPRLTALASGQTPGTAEIAAAQAVRWRRFAVGPTSLGMPQLPAEEERGARAGAAQRRGAGRTGGAGSGGPASPGAVGRAGPGQRHGERCAWVRPCSEGCLRGRKIRMRSQEGRFLALCRALG